MGGAEKEIRTKLFLIIEVFGRDLPGRFAIADKIKLNTAKVYVIEQELARRIPSWNYKDALVYDKSAANSKTRLKFYKRIKQAGGRIIIEDEEANAIFSSMERYIASRIDPKILQLIDYFLCWNEFQLATLQEKFPDYSAKFVLTGSSKYDSFRKAVHHNDEKEDAILVPSNFSLLTNFRTIDDYLKFKKKHERTPSNNYHIYQSIWDRVEFEIDLLKQLAKTKVLHIRPHPSDNLQRLREIFEGTANIHVLGPAPLSVHFARYSSMMHFNCNSSLEARLAGLSVINLSRQPHKHLSMDVQCVVGKDSIEKISQLINEEYEFKDATCSIDLFWIFSNLLKLEYFIRKILGRPTAKYFAKKNILFLENHRQQKITRFAKFGYIIL